MPVESSANLETDAFSWQEEDWDRLTKKINLKMCTPFLGAGASYPTLPLGSQIARTWAKECGYPFTDVSNLVRVAQFVAIQEEDGMAPKEDILELLQGQGPPDFSKPDEIHRLVADLELPVYITTNYDNFMAKALMRDHPKREPRQEICKWHKVRQGQPVPLPSLAPTREHPLVFHLHGHLSDLNSLVLTEDDYLDFLITLSENADLLPPTVQEAFTNSSVLFLGYSLEDMNFKVIFRKLASYYAGRGRKHFSVQLQPKAPGEAPTEEEVEMAKKQLTYLHKHYGRIDVKVFWGSCSDFARELRSRIPSLQMK
jgi:hypothetical protein